MDQLISEENGDARGTILALIPDLFFSVTVRNTIRRLGFEPRIVRNAGELIESIIHVAPVLAVCDLSAIKGESDWETIEDVVAEGVPTLVFGAHKDVDGLRRAKAAKVTRVVSNGQFHREMADIIERYAVAPACPIDADVEAEEDLASGSLPPGEHGEISRSASPEISSVRSSSPSMS
jgi:hypothetical protein